MAQRMPNGMYIVCSRFQLECNKYYMTCTLCILHILKYWLSPGIFTNCTFNWLEIILSNLIVCRSACIVTYLLYIFNCWLRSMFSFVGVNVKKKNYWTLLSDCLQSAKILLEWLCFNQVQHNINSINFFSTS